MTITFETTLEDLLTYQKYFSSQNPAHIKARSRVRYLLTLAYLILALVIYYMGYGAYASFFVIGIAVIAYIIYPKVQKSRFVSNYKKQIQKSLSKNMNQQVSIDILKHHIVAKDFKTETKMKAKDLDQLIELTSIFILTTKKGSNLLVPKSAINHIADFRKEVLNLGANIQDQNDWRW